MIPCFSQSPNQTKKLGQVLARQVLKRGPQRLAVVLALIGDLGGGKTTFLQGLAQGLAIKEKILSPTFVLMKRFSLPRESSQAFGFENFYHFDCYRIEKSKEIISLDFSEIIKNPKNIVAIEWADRLKKRLPPGSIVLKFQFVNPKKRIILVSPF